MPRAAARGGMATGDRGVARRAKTGLPRHSVVPASGFGGVPLGFATDAPRGNAGSFTGTLGDVILIQTHSLLGIPTHRF